MATGKIRWWAFWRRVQYGSGFGAVVSLIVVGLYFGFFYTAPQCFDGEQNGAETGVDCGGVCTRICAAEVIPPRVVWAQSFKVRDGQYNAVGYIENRNVNAATPAVTYTLELRNGSTTLAQRRGTTILPPGSTYPIFEGRIVLPAGVTPTETVLQLDPVELWVPAELGRAQFKTTEISLSGADRNPRLRAVLENTALTTARSVEVVATIFDAENRPLTASQTIIDELPGQAKREVVFTWPEPIAKTVRTCEVPSDIMIVLDRSGSMAADGGTPPEPLESAKTAAQTFVQLLQPRDTFGFLSYATTPSTPLEQPLTSDRARIIDAIAQVNMGNDGTQYTNMGDAFTAALAELTSPRHRDDARKVMVFMTDGDVTRPLNPATNKPDRTYAAEYAQAAAARAKAEGVTIFAIGFGDFLTAPSGEVARDTALIKSFASSPEHYFEAPTATDLRRVYQEIASAICEVGPARIEVIPKTSTGFAELTP